MPPRQPPSPAVNDLIQEACNTLRTQTKPNITMVLRDIKNRTGHTLPYDTVRRRFLGVSLPPRKAHANQQLLLPDVEKVLVDWIIFLSDTSHPLTKRSVRKKAEALCGRKPGESWIRGFLERHPEIRLGKPSGLDPKRAQAFNKPTARKHFDQLRQLIQKHDIPNENIYNMDEKGCQRGGGRRGSGRKCFVPRRRRPQYKSRSANLELITIIECVCADGTSLLPGFVFSGKEFCPEWFAVNPKIG